jgi:F-type H+-transporting ATPase subunit b
MINLNFSLVIAFLYVLILYGFMNHFFFKPITRILRERRALIQGRLEESQQRITQVEHKAAEYEQALRAAKADAYRQQELQRENVMAEKADILAKAKAEAEQVVKEGRVRIAAEAEAARKRLEADLDTMAKELTATVLRD